MKKTLAYLLPLLLITGMLHLNGCSGCSITGFKPLAAEKVDQAQKQSAERIAFRTLSAWRDGQFEPLSNDFTLQMIDALPPREQRKANESIEGMFGKFEALEFAEAVASDKLPNMVVYRFRGTFSAAKSKPEIRVVIDQRGKVAGFWCKPWLKIML